MALTGRWRLQPIVQSGVTLWRRIIVAWCEHSPA
jgi:hypothetical protein